MKTTWSEIKNQVQKLLYADDTVNNEYEKYYIDSANYAIMEISRYVRPNIEKITISHFPDENLISKGGADDFAPLLHTNEDILYTAQGAKSFYFEADGTGTLNIKNESGTIIKTVEFSSSHVFKPYKGFIDDNGLITLEFTGNYRYRIRNIALYGGLYSSSEEDIQPFSGYCVYDMIDLTMSADEGRTFLAFAEDFPVMKRETGFGWADCREMRNYVIQKGNLLLLPRSSPGEYEVYYKKYPAKITQDTQDSFEIDVDCEAVFLIPLLMAYRILKEDDERLAKTYYNEYQAAKEELLSSPVKSIIMPAEIWMSGEDGYGL